MSLSARISRDATPRKAAQTTGGPTTTALLPAIAVPSSAGRNRPPKSGPNATSSNSTTATPLLVGSQTPQGKRSASLQKIQQQQQQPPPPPSPHRTFSTSTEVVGGMLPRLPSTAGSSFAVKEHSWVPSQADSGMTPPPATAAAGTGHVSKLDAEVERLAQRGAALVRKEGNEMEGVALLAKALWAKVRFPSLASSSSTALWAEAEHLVILCLKIALKGLRTFRPDVQLVTNAIMQNAEQILTDANSDALGGFHLLRQHLIGLSLNTIAGMQRQLLEPAEDTVITLERAVRVEGHGVSTLTLFNLAAAYLAAGRYDDSCEAVTRCIELANLILSLPVSAKAAASPSWEQVVFNTATHATLGHLMISALAEWAGISNVSMHHAQLALSCAMTYLGTRHALSTRCARRVEALESRLYPSNNNSSNISKITLPSNHPSQRQQQQTFSEMVDDGEAGGALDWVVSPTSNSTVNPPAQNRNNNGNNRLANSILLHSQSLLIGEPAGSPLTLTSPRLPRTGSSAAVTLVVPETPDDAAPVVPLQGGWLGSKTLMPSALVPFCMSLSIPPAVAAFVDRVAAHREPPVRTRSQQPPTLFPALAVPKTPLLMKTPSSTSNVASPNLQGTLTSFSSTAGSDAASLMRPRKPPTAQPSPSISGGGVSGGKRSFRGGVVEGAPSQADLTESMESTTGLQDVLSAGSVASSAPSSARPLSSRSQVAVSILPKNSFSLYEKLQQDVMHLLVDPQPLHLPRAPNSSSGIGSVSGASAGGGGGPGSRLTSDRGRVAGSKPFHRQIHSIGALTGALEENQPPTVTAEEAMRLSDLHLRTLSLLRPDHTEEDERNWQRSATKIQKVYRAHRVRRAVVRPKRDEVQAYQRVLPMLERMMTFLANLRACRESKQTLRRLREERRLRNAVVAVQTHLRQLQSLNEAGGRYKAELEAIWTTRRLARQRQIAAIAIQAKYRGYRSRVQLSRQLRAVRVIQRTYRIYRLYCTVRLVVFQVRGYRRERERIRNAAASRVQRWWRWMRPKLHALEAFRVRHEASQRYLESLVNRDEQYWAQVSHLDEDECRAMLARVLRGLFVRTRQGRVLHRLRRLQMCARKIQRWYRFSTAQAILHQREIVKKQSAAIRRRREEVHEATLDIQRIVRAWFAKKRVFAIRQTLPNSPKRVAAAVVIQRAARQYLRRGELRQRRAERQRLQRLYLTAATRTDAAVRIQSAYRMHRVRHLEIPFFRTFMTVDRHIYASRIQQLVRRSLAKSEVRRRDGCIIASRAEQKALALRDASATHIQSVVRMFLCREKVRCDPLTYRAVRPTVARRLRAAVKLQSLWRAYAATQYIRQLRAARKFVEGLAIQQEHLHVYATVIQCAVRKYILARHRYGEACTERRLRAARTLQRFAHHVADRRRALQQYLLLEERETLALLQEAHVFSALRIQKLVRGHLTRRNFRLLHRAATKIANAFRCFRAKKTLELSKQARAVETQRMIEEEQHLAARTIQNAWRERQRQASLTPQQQAEEASAGVSVVMEGHVERPTVSNPPLTLTML